MMELELDNQFQNWKEVSKYHEKNSAVLALPISYRTVFALKSDS